MKFRVTCKKGIDVSTFDKEGKRLPSQAKFGAEVDLTIDRALRLVNLVEPLDSKAYAEAKQELEVKAVKAKADKRKAVDEKATAKKAEVKKPIDVRKEEKKADKKAAK